MDDTNLTVLDGLDYHEEGNSSDWTFEVTFEFIVHGILINSVGVLGLLGNIFSIVVLSRPQMKSSINTLLIGLVACDSLLIITSFFMFCFTVFRYTKTSFFLYYYWKVYPYIAPFVYPVGLIAQTGSAYLTLAVTIERYLVVCWPLQARSVCTQSRAKSALVCVIGLAVVYNLPRFFEITWDDRYVEVYAETRTVFLPTNLRMDPTYISIYVTWMYLVFMYIVPFASLAIFNMLIFLEIRRASARRAMLSNQEKREHNLATMLLVVVMVFFICNILPLVVNILELFEISNQPLIQVSNFLVTINSSINILIYCLFGNKFKTIFLQIFCGRKPHIQTMTTLRSGNGAGGGHNIEDQEPTTAKDLTPKPTMTNFQVSAQMNDRTSLARSWRDSSIELSEMPPGSNGMSSSSGNNSKISARPRRQKSGRSEQTTPSSLDGISICNGPSVRVNPNSNFIVEAIEFKF